jgi:predicted metal-dependent HD superfamily phosphohydrolase
VTPAASLAVLGLPASLTDAWIAQLSEPQRAYHTLAHIHRMLADVPQEHAAARELVAAIWLHDIVYDPMRSDNEERSAEQALRDLAGTDIDAAHVAELILGTRHHRGGSALQSVLDDLDLTILGASAAEYADYAEAIRREYRHLPEDTYRAGRAAVLRHFLERERIYHGAHLSAREVAARSNLGREIETLERG